ncbi:HNH endonuclease [Streptomyces sp. NPDC051104]|uniref:HNH endonuclease n=1 Tax=Streptomyces sp. NPDC051104 TaxID=3155044 RepID=UPI003434D326
MGITFGDPRLPDRFWSKTRVSNDGCWSWTAAKSIGYGKISWEGKSRHAHIVAYTVLVGPVPDGHVIDHECHHPSNCAGGNTCPHRACVNPNHMVAKTSQANTSTGRVSHAGSRKTHCPSGHPYDGRNVRIGSDGGRYCRECERLRSRRRVERFRAGEASPMRHRVTHCPEGHEYTPENTGYNTSNGGRYCRECHRTRWS